MAEKKVQEQLFQAIREGLPPGVSFIDAIAETLHLSTDSAYRRIRGETPVVDEAQERCRHFSLSPGQLLQAHSDAVVFHPVLVNQQEHSFHNFLAGLLQRLQHRARRATLLNDGNERQRRVFFNSLLKQIPYYQSVFNTFCY